MKNLKWVIILMFGLYGLSSCEDEFDYIDPNADPNLVDSTEIIIDPPVDSTWVDPNDPCFPIDSTEIDDPWFPIDSMEIDDPWFPIDSTWVDPNNTEPDTTNLGG